MAKTVKVDSPTSRAKLEVQHEPHWRQVGNALSLGYRKGSDKGSSWIARGFDGSKYRKKTLGEPDDRRDADGVEVLTFSQAVEAAFKWWHTRNAPTEAIAEASAAPVTVAIATAEYCMWYVEKGGKDVRSLDSRIRLHIAPTFADVEVSKLTKLQIEKWHRTLASTGRLHRPSKATGLSKSAPLDKSDFDAVRRRRSAANRTLTVLKAILNKAFRDHDAVTSDKAWRTVEPFEAVDAARERALSEKEVASLLAATSGPFRDLVQAALFTGCRYGELAGMTVGDLDAKQGTAHVARSKSGHPRDVVLTSGAVDLLKRLANGRQPRERLFLRSDGDPWRPSDQLRPMRAACKVAGIEPPVGYHILRHSYASELVMRGVGLQTVARQIGHRSTVMTERHYAHLSSSYVAEQIRGALPDYAADQTDKNA